MLGLWEILIFPTKFDYFPDVCSKNGASFKSNHADLIQGHGEPLLFIFIMTFIISLYVGGSLWKDTLGTDSCHPRGVEGVSEFLVPIYNLKRVSKYE